MLRQRAGIRAALAAARPEGTVVVVGGGHGGLDALTILVKELRVQGCFTYVDEFAEVIALLADGALQVADLTSEIASIDDAPGAFERLRDARTMKILVAPNGLRCQPQGSCFGWRGADLAVRADAAPMRGRPFFGVAIAR